jgi:hypothetical protein
MQDGPWIYDRAEDRDRTPFIIWLLWDIFL